MSRTANDPPEVTGWLRDAPRAATRQYAGPVRRFIREQGIEDVNAVTAAQLIGFATSIASNASRRKAISALESFFGYLLECGEIQRDPARRLAPRIREAMESQTLKGQLILAGMEAAAAANISWRDVARVVFDCDSGRPRRPMPRQDSPIMLVLTQRLLDRLRGLSADNLDRFLDSPVH